MIQKYYLLFESDRVNSTVRSSPKCLVIKKELLNAVE